MASNNNLQRIAISLDAWKELMHRKIKTQKTITQLIDEAILCNHSKPTKATSRTKR